MKPFRDLIEDVNKVLREAPQKMKGNAPFEALTFDKISNISEKVMNMNFSLVSKNFITVKQDIYDLYVSKNHPYYIIGKFYKETVNEDRFATIFELTFKINRHFKSKQKQLQGDVITIDTVHTADDFIGNKIAQTVYTHLLKKFIIISDQLQYEGAVNLWKRLISNNVVYIYDILEDKIISKVTPNTSESQIWSNDSSKRRIRLVMIP